VLQQQDMGGGGGGADTSGDGGDTDLVDVDELMQPCQVEVRRIWAGQVETVE
jgi:hypothetical protein